MAKSYASSNFHKHTFCVFTEVNHDSISSLQPNYTSKSGSSYYFTENGVYRLSNHWGRAANCKWRLQSTSDSKERTRLGYANWSEFHPDNSVEKLYFIQVDFESGMVNYQHKSNLNSEEQIVLRTASETQKIIKQIRNLFTSENWAKHFSMEIGMLRKRIVTELITSEKSIQQIKSDLLGE